MLRAGDGNRLRLAELQPVTASYGSHRATRSLLRVGDDDRLGAPSVEVCEDILGRDRLVLLDELVDVVFRWHVHL